MNDLSAPGGPERPAFEPVHGRGQRLGFVSQEPLDTMLRLERTPPPLLGVLPQGHADPRDGAGAHGVSSNRDRLAAVRMKVKLAELVIALEDEVRRCGDDAVLDGFVEVHRFLLHTQHLRLLREG